MAGRNSDIKVTVRGDADFGAARREAKDALDDIEREAKDVKLSPELDTADIRKAIALAEQLDGMVATLDIDADPADIVQAEKLARSLRGFQARVDLSVEGKAELTEALGLADKMEGLRKVRVEVQGRQDLERAAEIADDLERRRTVPIDAQASDLVRLDDQVAEALSSGGEAGSEGIAGALGDIDFEDIGSSGAEKLTSSLAAAGPWAAAAAGVGAIFGDEFLEGFNNALPDSRGDTIRALRTNLSPDELAAVGRAGGDAYSSGLAEGLSGAKDTAAQLQGQLGRIDEAFDLKEVTRQATALEQVFGVDMTESINAVAKLVSQGLVADSREGFDLLFELGQQTQGQFDEMLTSTDEFSTSIKALGIEGPRGLKLIGEMIRTGIFEQADQAGEVFSELNETIISGGAHDALVQLGVDAESFTADIAAGGPLAASAVAEIATQLLAVDDNAEQAQLTAQIFGGNMGLLGDEAREAALQLFSTADGIDIVGTEASDAADQIEGSASGLDRLKKVAVELGDELGGTVADGIDTLNSLAEMDFGAAASSAASFGEALGIKLLGPLGEIASRGPDWLDPFGKLKDSWHELTDEAPAAVAGAESLSTAAREGAPAMDDLAEAATGAADGVDQVTQSADELEAQLRGLFDFSADQLFRDIADGVDQLAEAMKDGGTKAVEMAGGIDISTKAGRDLQDQMEGLNGTLIDAEVAYANNEISAQELADVHGTLEAKFRDAGRAAGLTEGEVQGLIDKYLAVPSDVVTNLRAVDNATAVVNNLKAALSGLKDKTITVTTRNAIVAATAATANARARGGWTDGLTLVGEEGPELIDVKGRAFVHTAAETRELMSNRGGALNGPGPAAGAGGPRVNIERLIVDKGVDVWQQLQLAELVYGGRR